MVIGFEIHAARGNKLSTLNIYGKKGGREGGGPGRAGARQGSRARGIARTTRRCHSAPPRRGGVTFLHFTFNASHAGRVSPPTSPTHLPSSEGNEPTDPEIATTRRTNAPA